MDPNLAPTVEKTAREKWVEWYSDPVTHATSLAHKREYHAGRVAFHKEYCRHHYRAVTHNDPVSIAWLDANREMRAEELRQRVFTRRERARATQRRHTYKRRGASGRHTEKEWRALCSSFDERCAYCGARAALTVDHVVPITRGGSNSIENILPACMSCNRRKNARLLSEWTPPSPLFNPRDAVMPFIPFVGLVMLGGQGDICG
jgi:5-methylcytosine-specific restriction endonuclease McrA